MNNYPEDSLQYLTNSWWEEDDTKDLLRGSLVLAHIQFFYNPPLELIAGRVYPNDHSNISMKAQPLSLNRGTANSNSLPIAALPRLDGAECHIINRAKRRPCLVIGEIKRPSISRHLTLGMAKHSTAPFIPIAPYFGVDQTGRAGYNNNFVEKTKHACYPQFMWDRLPHTGKESILRFDHIQPLGMHYMSYKKLKYKLSNDAMDIIDEWLLKFINGTDGEFLPTFRKLIESHQN
ncbi:MAG: hypothetical protein GY730_05890 [bacterium]|nr:hypothetical protein [bacterium]